MKNKMAFQKWLFKVIIIFLCFLGLFLIINLYEYRIYTNNFNQKINNIVDTLQNKYPNVSEKEIIEILNSEGNTESKTLKKYGLSLNDKAIVLENNEKHQEFLLFNMLILILGMLSILSLFIIYLRKRDKEIREITKYIEEINKKNYSLKIDSNSEDELSILKNEIYKTTVMLKETAENSKKDKENLKISLEDISHQLKTPLTSILIMLDNLIDDANMEKETRDDFLRDIKRNIININFLVQSLLKLSKFEANTIKFTKEKQFLKNLINESLKNVSTLCDLKNIKINVKGDDKAQITCDFRWQTEALTNIIKNCVEHSLENSSIDISYTQNKVYAMITIKDYGEGIMKKEIPHIFERFYQGKNASFDSMGIGLSLAKTIIENNNGLIKVKSLKKGTEFIIKYFNI